MIPVCCQRSLTDSRQRTLWVDENEAEEMERVSRTGLPTLVMDRTSGKQYAVAWINCGSSYRAYVILREC